MKLFCRVENILLFCLSNVKNIFRLKNITDKFKNKKRIINGDTRRNIRRQ